MKFNFTVSEFVDSCFCFTNKVSIMSSNSDSDTSRPSNALYDLIPCTPEELSKCHYEFNGYEVKSIKQTNKQTKQTKQTNTKL